MHTIKHMYPQVGQSKYFCCLLIREVLTRKKKSVKFHTWGGDQDKTASFSHFFYFFLSCPKSCKSAKKIFFSIGGWRYPLT